MNRNQQANLDLLAFLCLISGFVWFIHWGIPSFFSALSATTPTAEVKGKLSFEPAVSFGVTSRFITIGNQTFFNPYRTPEQEKLWEIAKEKSGATCVAQGENRATYRSPILTKLNCP